jgi:hypothetical protein
MAPASSSSAGGTDTGRDNDDGTHHARRRFLSDYELPLAYPARVVSVGTRVDGGGVDDDDDATSSSSRGTTMITPRTSSDFVNARLLDAGVSLDGRGLSASSHSSSSSLESHSDAVGRFVRDMRGTGCYDAVRVRIGMPSSSMSSSSSPSTSSSGRCDVSVQLREKRWYKLHVGGGINADDISSLGGGGGRDGRWRYGRWNRGSPEITI